MSHTFWKLNYAAGLTAAIFVFLYGDWTSFFQSLGVFLLVVARRTCLHEFVPLFLRQLQSFFYLAERRPFPPPQYPNDHSGENHNVLLVSFPYSTWQACMGVIFISGCLGWNGVKPIPLVPSWLGAVGVAVFAVYLSTLGDSTGDGLRFVGYTATMLWISLMRIANEVDLQENLGAVLGHTLFFFKDIDKQFQMRRRLQSLVGEVLSKITMLYAMHVGGNLASSSNNEIDNHSDSNNGNRRNGGSSQPFQNPYEQELETNTQQRQQQQLQQPSRFGNGRRTRR